MLTVRQKAKMLNKIGFHAVSATIYHFSLLLSLVYLNLCIVRILHFMRERQRSALSMATPVLCSRCLSNVLSPF